jgi:hypothetical protein
MQTPSTSSRFSVKDGQGITMHGFEVAAMTWASVWCQ